ncbi:FAD/NAD(P)-binding domain-containing protein [Corynespora cassiicola Philippines]|uniref:FAD/NAD(P)-binding domain-containing protein n=1 Tax=Corynespora cassiicola Philippines TaxID=1448308 RepID=A0A2T2NGX5_CORCC|nr:FAD/NAD(P)-binding domain-containing protein [Corynespora cassiicola Philippines]
MPPNLNILISGAGIAGPCLAWWLHHHFPTSTSITLVDRYPRPRTTGQAVDIRSTAVDVIRRMGLEPAIRAKTTTEEGLDFVYADGVNFARFPASGDVESQGFTSEFEILRGDLAGIFYEGTRGLEGVRYVFDEFVKEIVQEEEKEGGGKVRVRFANGLSDEEFDLVVGADGMISPTRRLVFGEGEDGKQYLKFLGQYLAYFTIPRVEAEDSKFAQWYNAPKGRLIFIRPDQYGETRCYFGVTDTDKKRFEEIEKAMKEGKDAQQDWFEKEFEGAGFKAERLVREMRNSKDWYCQMIAQVKMEDFVKGRFALLGDAGFCPSPISGMGTATAITAAYLLAGELSKISSTSDIPDALKNYQKAARPFINQAQSLFPGTPQIANPQTELGIKVFNTVTGITSSTWSRKFGSLLGSLIPVSIAKKIQTLPDYEKVDEGVAMSSS